ncbi:MAG: hypothetical protein ACT4OZ_14975 [Gemmatimonadota bacterium]
MAHRKLVLCLRNEGYEASLERRKIYRMIPDRTASARQQVRVVDESGDDYLYPATMFAPIELSRAVQRAVFAAV